MGGSIALLRKFSRTWGILSVAILATPTFAVSGSAVSGAADSGSADSGSPVPAVATPVPTAVGTPRPEPFTVRTAASTTKITAGKPGALEPFSTSPADFLAARGEWVSFQIVVTAGANPVSQLRIAPEQSTGPTKVPTGLRTPEIFWENYVDIPHPSGNRRLAKAWWPDALIPISLRPTCDIETGHSVVAWICFRVPRDAEPGKYTLQYDASCDGGTQRIPVHLTIASASLPAWTMRANVAVYYDLLRQWYAKNGRNPSDAEFAELKKNYYESLLHYGLNAYDLPVAWDTPDAERYLRETAVRSVRLPALNSPDFSLAVATCVRLKVLNKAYYYWIDEPAPERFAEIHQATANLRSHNPALKQCVTIAPLKELDGVVDIWCPNVGDALALGHLSQPALARERRNGRETWWYTMVEPTFPYPTWLVDDDGGAVRLYGWMMARWHITGFVYSMAHGWGPKPLEDIQTFAGTNGDGVLLYPAAALDPDNLHPMPSIRLMLIREAMQDYELLQLLPAAARQELTSHVVLGPTAAFHAPYETIDWKALHARLLHALAPDVPVTPLIAAMSQVDWTQISREKLSIGTPFRNRIPTLAPPIKNKSTPIATWPDSSRCLDAFRRYNLADSISVPGTKLWLGRHKNTLYARFQATGQLSGWVAIDLAPREGTERWRFVVAASGKAYVEKHSNQGGFAIEGVQWQHSIIATPSGYNVEMSIPCSQIGLPLASTPIFRLNALRRVTDPALGLRYTLSVHPDSGDVMLMPLVAIN